MEKWKKQFISVSFTSGLLIWLVILTSGCSQYERRTIYRDVRDNRQQAYRRWEKQRTLEEETLLSGKLNLSDAIQIGIIHNKRLRAVVQERDIAEGRIIESYGQALPHVTVNANYTRLDEVGSLNVGGQTVRTGFVDNYSTELEIRQPLYKGGSIGAALRTAKVFSLFTDEAIRAQYQQTLYEIASSYFEVLLAQQLYQANRDAVESAQAQLRDVQARRETGLANEFDVLRTQVDVSNFRAEMIQQRNRIHLAQTRLYKAMGVSQESRVELSDELTYTPFNLNMHQAVETAFKNRPDLYRAEYSIQIQELGLQVAQSERMPDLDAVFSQRLTKPDPHDSSNNEWEDAWQAQLILEWPLFAGRGIEGRVLQQRARLRQLGYELLDTQEQALLEVQQAILNLQDAAEFVDSQRLNLQRAQEGLRLAQVGYRQGVNRQVEVTDARAALTRARSLYYEAIYDHTIARLDLQLAMGVLGRPEGPFEVEDKGEEMGYEQDFDTPNPEGDIPGMFEPAQKEPLPEKDNNTR